MTDGSVVLRLQAAERHLAELENVLPVEAQRKQAGGEVQNAEARLKQAQRERDARARHVASRRSPRWGCRSRSTRSGC